MTVDRAQQLVVVRALRRARAEQELSDSVIAIRSGLSSRTIRRVLKGDTFDWRTVAAVAAVLRVEITLTAFTPRERASGEGRS
jgi:transcriptional regulator with XRE-family HTH domain